MSADAMLKHIILGMRFQPIYSVREQRINAWEVLSLLSHGADSEIFFSSLTSSVVFKVLQWQLQVIRELSRDKHYFLNAPTDLLCQTDMMFALLPLLRTGITIEIQDPHCYLALNEKMRHRFWTTCESIKYTGAEVWLDDILPEHIPALIADFSNFSGIKIDKNVLWRSQSIPALLHSLVTVCSPLVSQIIIEGVESYDDVGMAIDAGGTSLQGYLWPEEQLRFNYIPG